MCYNSPTKPASSNLDLAKILTNTVTGGGVVHIHIHVCAVCVLVFCGTHHIPNVLLCLRCSTTELHMVSNILQGEC